MNDAKYISGAPGVTPQDVHPTSTAGGKFKGTDLPPYMDSDGRESKFVRCKQCGFICNRDVNPKGSGWGNVSIAEVLDLTDTAARADNPTVTGGCPFCGSSEYE